MNDRKPSYKPTGAWVWQSKEALSRIRDGYDGKPGLTNALAVYVALSEFANRDGAPTFQRRQRDIAAMAGLSTRSVAHVLPTLQELGVVSWIQTTGEGGHPLGPNTYTITAYPYAANADPSAPIAHPCARVEKAIGAENIEELEEPKRTPKNTLAASADCELIYSFYPRKVAKGQALQAIGKALSKGVLVEDLLRSVKQFAEATSRWSDSDRNYIPHPATWFNTQRWLDDPTSWNRNSRESHEKEKGGGQSDGTAF